VAPDFFKALVVCINGSDIVTQSSKNHPF